MNKKDFATLSGFSYSQWQAVLKGDRNMSLNKARFVAKMLNTKVMVWIDKEQTKERQDAWLAFKEASK